MKRYLHLLLTLLLLSVCTVGGAQTTVTFTAGTDKGTDGGNASKDVSITKDGITLHSTISSGNAGVYGRTDNYRFYKGSKLEVSSTVGNITKVVFTCTANGDVKYGPGCFSDPSKGSYVFSDKIGTWTGDAASFTLTASTNQVRATKIEVTYTPTGGKTKTTTTLAFADGDKTFTQGDTDGLTFTNAATLTPAVDGATITYSSSDKNIATVDETGKVSVKTDNTGSATITATYAGDDTYASSTAWYNITVAPKLTGAGTEANPYTVADVIALNNAGQLPSYSVYVKGIVCQVDELSTSYGNATYYISDDGTTTDQLEIFRGKYLNNAKFTSEDQLKAGWTVTVTGTPIYYNNKTLELNSGNYITSIVKPSSYTAATLPSSNFATSGNDSYATFSSDQVTFFPESDENMTFTTDVQKAYALSDMMELKTLETANATINGKEVSGYFVPANTGVLLKVSFDGGTSITYYKVTGKDDVAALTDNMLYPATKAMSELTNCYFYKLAYDDYSNKTGLGFYWGAADGAAFTAKTGGAYLAVEKNASAKSGFRFDGTTTGVNTINAKTTTNDVIYNIQGQRVGANYKGLVIVNGKKMMRK